MLDTLPAAQAARVNSLKEQQQQQQQAMEFFVECKKHGTLFWPKKSNPI